jgi:hypothetical protein
MTLNNGDFEALPPADDARVDEICEQYQLSPTALRSRYQRAFDGMIAFAERHANGEPIGVSESRGPNLRKVVTIGGRYTGEVDLDLSSDPIAGRYKTSGNTETGTFL